MLLYLNNVFRKSRKDDIMKKRRIPALLLSCVIALSASPISVFAEDYEADVSSAEKSSDWGQTFKLYFDTFDFSTLTEESEVHVEYTVKSDNLTESPVELIVQSWEEYDEETNELKGDGEIWGKVAPTEYDDHSAVFTYADMLEAYKSAAENPDDITDLSNVLCLNIGSTNQGEILCTSLTITNVNESNSSTIIEATGINVVIPVETPTETTTSDEIVRITENDFDATRINSNTKLVIRYAKMDEKPAFCPVNVVLISENNTTAPENKRDENGNVSVKLTLPESYNEEKVVFNCKQILNAYGTGDFSELTDFSIVGTSQKITIESIEFTDVNQFGVRSKLNTQEEEESGGVSTLLVVGVIAVIVIIALVVIFFVIKSNSGKSYDISTGTYIKNKPDEKADENNKK